MLTIKQQKCVELMALGELTQKEIAEQIKVSEQSICKWKKDSDFMREYDKLIRSGIQSLAAKAFQTQVKLLDARNEMVRYMTAKDILDRAGFKADDKLKVENALPVVIVDDMGDEDDDN